MRSGALLVLGIMAVGCNATFEFDAAPLPDAADIDVSLVDASDASLVDAPDASLVDASFLDAPLEGAFDGGLTDVADGEAGAADVATVAMDARPEGSASPDGGREGVGSIECGSDTCLLPQERCCAWDQGSVCLSNQTPCGALLLRCDGPEDCPAGLSCCGQMWDGRVVSSECEERDECEFEGDVIFCNPRFPDTCDDYEWCVDFPVAPLPRGYHRCR